MIFEVDIQIRSIFATLFAAVTARFHVIIAHRRAGKTVASIQKLFASALDAAKPNSRFAYIAPLRNQAKNIAWDYLKRFAHQIKGAKINESELRVDFPNGSRIQLYGSDNPDSLRGGYLDGVVLDEVAQMPPDTWTHVVRPMLADRKGWAVFIGTPAGKNVFFDLWEKAGVNDQWERHMFRASETGLVSSEELDDASKTMSPEAYEQEFECSFTAAIRGAYYGRVMERIETEGHFLPIDVDPTQQIITSWDLGVRDSTSIWVLQPYRGNAWAAVDFYENTGEGVDHYIDWLNQHGYNRNAVHLGPHDVKNRDWGTVGGQSRMKVAEDLGLKFKRVERAKNNIELMEQINALRNQLERFYFHNEDTDRGARVSRGRLALSLYRQAYNDKLGALQANPVHDWTSHAADALRTKVACKEDILRGSFSSEHWDRSKRANIRARAPQRQRASLGYSRRG